MLTRELLGYRHHRAAFDCWLEPARPELTLMIDLDGELTADGIPLPDAWIGGMGDRPTIVGFGATYGSIDLKLDPIGAYALTAMPLSELAAGCVPLREVLGPSADELVERVRDVSDWDVRFDLVQEFLLARLADGPRVDPAVAWAWQRLCRTGGTVRIQELAAEIGCSRRYLSKRFHRQVGLPPKTVARLLRFHAVRARIAAAPARWGDIALQAGYADQAHLNREFRELAGVTPSDFVARQIPEGGIIGDPAGGGSSVRPFPFVQDGG